MLSYKRISKFPCVSNTYFGQESHISHQNGTFLLLSWKVSSSHFKTTYLRNFAPIMIFHIHQNDLFSDFQPNWQKKIPLLRLCGVVHEMDLFARIVWKRYALNQNYNDTWMENSYINIFFNCGGTYSDNDIICNNTSTNR